MSHLTNDGIRRSDRHHPSSLSHQPPTTNIETITTTTIPTTNDDQPSSNTPDILTPANFHTTLQNDPDLSYQSSNPRSDPPESLDGSSTRYRSTSPTTITRIESSINQLSSRLNSIEVNNDNRMTLLEQQLLDSQTRFQTQLLQSQTAITTLIKSTLSNLHQHIPPPPTQQEPSPLPPPPNLPHTTPSPHTDPPTNPTPAPPQKPTSPDPPATTYQPPPTRRVTNPYTTPRIQHHHTDLRPTPTPPPPVPTHYQTTSPSPTNNTNHPPPTIIVQAPTQVPKLSIDSYKPKNGYNHFKKMTLLSISADPHYSDIVQVGTDGNLEFNPNMETKHSKSLFCATLKALGTNASEAVNTNAIDSNALTLWKSLDNHFHRSTTSHILKQKLKKDYEQLKKAPNESFAAYVSKFENSLETLYHNEINPGTKADIAYQFLASLSLPKVFNDILMQLDSTSEWALGHDLWALSYRAAAVIFTTACCIHAHLCVLILIV
jgi:hypothetical protein